MLVFSIRTPFLPVPLTLSCRLQACEGCQMAVFRQPASYHGKHMVLNQQEAQTLEFGCNRNLHFHLPCSTCIFNFSYPNPKLFPPLKVPVGNTMSREQLYVRHRDAARQDLQTENLPAGLKLFCRINTSIEQANTHSSVKIKSYI